MRIDDCNGDDQLGFGLNGTFDPRNYDSPPHTPVTGGRLLGITSRPVGTDINTGPVATTSATMASSIASSPTLEPTWHRCCKDSHGLSRKPLASSGKACHSKKDPTILDLEW